MVETINSLVSTILAPQRKGVKLTPFRRNSCQYEAKTAVYVEPFGKLPSTILRQA